MTSFSDEIAEKIFRDYPEWKEFSREERYDGGDPFLVVEVPPPQQADTSFGLVISTDNDEVTVSFDYYHSHFDEWSSTDVVAEQFCALPFVQSILSETVAVISWWRGDEWKGSCQQPAGTSAAPVGISDFTRIRVRSWMGTFNEDRDA